MGNCRFGKIAAVGLPTSFLHQLQKKTKPAADIENRSCSMMLLYPFGIPKEQASSRLFPFCACFREQVLTIESAQFIITRSRLHIDNLAIFAAHHIEVVLRGQKSALIASTKIAWCVNEVVAIPITLLQWSTIHLLTKPTFYFENV